ncbi:AmmeMemoRadiSam system radical SAM enzyme [Permianibacter aggregans]|uniref:Pyruvate formate lyase activating enzyme n=1 Tax=Permianibacter aggregans TaxID=1510150 RepID=A0A4R6UVB1_9GAMM|nr:AmmeMemoRadiSam system radical SAM enzyme [Permianibacter aggregans]TDQ47434.1 pyruvate formate lyase activating enzyme [Permianibacter aggregans]
MTNVMNDAYTIPGRYWYTMDDGRLHCTLCPRSCKIHEGQRGLCFVRGAEAGQMWLYSYGRSSGFCIDPIEKKPLNHFLPGSSVLSFGTAGCNLACKFCQNWDISKAREMDKLASYAGPEQIATHAKQLGCRSIAFTYNDPVIFLEYAVDCAQAAHEQGLKAVAVTAGYITEQARPEFYRYMDAANVDLKAFTESFYKKLCGASLEAVKETLVYLRKETTVWFEITTLLIPDHNDSDEEIHEMCTWIAEHIGVDVPLHFTAFHPDFKMMDIPRTPASTLTRARDIALKYGLHYVYTGNVHDRLGSSTYCPNCHRGVIERDWYELGEYVLDVTGHCRHCGTTISGVFDGLPERFGRRRIPVSLSA